MKEWNLLGRNAEIQTQAIDKLAASFWGGEHPMAL